MAPLATCQRCGTRLDLFAPEGMCTRCLLRMGLAASTRDEPQSGAGGVDAVSSSPSANAANQPIRFGDYELIEEIGHGGMGLVYQARQSSLGRVVALKLLLRGPYSSPELLRRFRREAQIAAGLQHPGIVAVYEVGEVEGQAYIAMEYVSGRSLAKTISDFGSQVSDFQSFADWLKEIAEAIDHAHQHGIVHRDLKPANILIDTEDRVRVTDFGLAKWFGPEAGRSLVEPGSSDSSSVTRFQDLTLTGQILGSPDYLAPEQASGRHDRDLPPVDIYAMGAILYELLTGRPPFRSSSIQDTLLRIRDAEPVWPRLLNASVPRDLEVICLKCLEKDPVRRYRSAAELVEELNRFLRGEPIQARPVGAVGRIWRWSKRKPALAGALATLAVVFAVGLGGVLSQWRRAEVNAREQRREAYYSKIAEAKANIDRGSIQQAMAVLLSCPEEYRHWEWGHLVQQCHQEIVSLRAHETAVVHLEFSPDGRRLVTLGVDGVLKVWDWNGDPPKMLFRDGDPTNRVAVVAHAPDGQRLALGLHTGMVRLFGTADWMEVSALGKEGERPTAMLWYPDNQRLVVAAADGKLDVWDTATGDRLQRLEGHARPVTSLRLSPDGQRLVSGDSTHVRVWDVGNGSLTAEFGAGLAEGSVVFGDPTGRTFAAVDPDNMVRLWCPARSAARSGMPVRMKMGSVSALPSSLTSSQPYRGSQSPSTKLAIKFPTKAGCRLAILRLTKSTSSARSKASNRGKPGGCSSARTAGGWGRPARKGLPGSGTSRKSRNSSSSPAARISWCSARTAAG